MCHLVDMQGPVFVATADVLVVDDLDSVYYGELIVPLRYNLREQTTPRHTRQPAEHISRRRRRNHIPNLNAAKATSAATKAYKAATLVTYNIAVLDCISSEHNLYRTMDTRMMTLERRQALTVASRVRTGQCSSVRVTTSTITQPRRIHFRVVDPVDPLRATRHIHLMLKMYRDMSYLISLGQTHFIITTSPQTV